MHFRSIGYVTVYQKDMQLNSCDNTLAHNIASSKMNTPTHTYPYTPHPHPPTYYLKTCFVCEPTDLSVHTCTRNKSEVHNSLFTWTYFFISIDMFLIRVFSIIINLVWYFMFLCCHINFIDIVISLLFPSVPRF